MELFLCHHETGEIPNELLEKLLRIHAQAFELPPFLIGLLSRRE
jgi:hypothetical protein